MGLLENIRERIDLYKGVLSRIDSIDSVIDQTVEEYKDDLLDINRDQMRYGRDSEGNILTPSYTSDPFFKTPQAARAYALMKDRELSWHNSLISHHVGFPEKDRDTPNLIVTGPFQFNMYINVTGHTHTIGSTYKDARNIERKYNPYGLAPLSVKYFWHYFMFESLYNWIWNGVRM